MVVSQFSTYFVAVISIRPQSCDAWPFVQSPRFLPTIQARVGAREEHQRAAFADLSRDRLSDEHAMIACVDDLAGFAFDHCERTGEDRRPRHTAPPIDALEAAFGKL